MGHTFNVILFLVICSLSRARAGHIGATLKVPSSIYNSRKCHVNPN